ncbi:MAG: Holliday junction resolvase RuvX [Cyanobium sp.]
MPAPTPCSALALDIGRRRIGLAGCDPLGLTITPLQALQRSSFEADLAQLRPLLRQRRVAALVFGLPLDDAGRPTAQARHCRRYGLRLAAALQAAAEPLPIAWVNEHSSSWAAGEQHGLHGDRSGRLDSAAAALLLEQWLTEGPAAGLMREAPPSEPVATATIRPEPGDGAASS